MTGMPPGQDPALAGRLADGTLAALALASCYLAGDEEGMLAVWSGRDAEAAGLAAVCLLTGLLDELSGEPGADVPGWIAGKRARALAELAGTA